MTTVTVEVSHWLFVNLSFCVGRNVYRMLFKSKSYERNELFLPGRMAYVVDLDDEYADTDIPPLLSAARLIVPPWR